MQSLDSYTLGRCPYCGAPMVLVGCARASCDSGCCDMPLSQYVSQRPSDDDLFAIGLADVAELLAV